MADVERRRVGLKCNRRFDGGSNVRARFLAYLITLFFKVRLLMRP